MRMQWFRNERRRGRNPGNEARWGRGSAFGAAMALLLAGAAPAEASHKVYSPIVEKGEVEIENRTHVTYDSDPKKDGAVVEKYSVGYGVTDHTFVEFYAVWNKSPGGARSYAATEAVVMHQLFEQGERWLDAALYFEYVATDASQNKPDKLEFKVLLEKGMDEWLNTLNVNFEKEIGTRGLQAAGLELGYAWKTKYRLSPLFEPGFEAYGALGEIGNTSSPSRQKHQIGPMVYGELGGFGYEVGWLFGLTGATPSGTLRFLVEYEF